MSDKFSRRVRSFAKANDIPYSSALLEIQQHEVDLLISRNITFESGDPVSPAWRAAWGRYVEGLLESFQSAAEEKNIKSAHHRGWRVGVNSVRRGRPPPCCVQRFTPHERRSWEHGAVAGRQATISYLQNSHTSAEKLR